MPSFRQPDVEERKQAAIAAKQAMLNRFKAAASDPELEKRKAERAAVAAARQEREAKREAARKLREAEKAEQKAREAERLAEEQSKAEAEAARLVAEEEELNQMILADQKAARDARYAARKLAKKQRRKGLLQEYEFMMEKRKKSS